MIIESVMLRYLLLINFNKIATDFWHFCLFYRCATVLTSYYEDMRFFIDHIEKFKLRMCLYFLGDNLRKVINKLESADNRSRSKANKFMVLHWNNSEIIDTTYEAISMPPCELYYDYVNKTNVCRYEITPVSIFYNKIVMGDKKLPDTLFHTLGKLHIESVNSIFEIYNKQGFADKIDGLTALDRANPKTKEDYYNEVACQWLNEHQEVYQTKENSRSWIHSEGSYKEIYIGGL